MKVWTSCEVMVDVYEAFGTARHVVERTLNAVCESRSYGPGVEKWAVIYIIMDKNDPNFPELQKYHRRRKVVEFRLKVDHESFRNASETDQQSLLAAAIVRSLECATSLAIPEFDINSFGHDVLECLQLHGWIRPS